MSISPETLVTRRTDLLEADVGGETVLMGVERGLYYGLDRIGSDVWRRLETPMRIDRLCGLLLQDYDGEAETVLRDVIDLVERLSAEGLVDAA